MGGALALLGAIVLLWLLWLALGKLPEKRTWIYAVGGEVEEEVATVSETETGITILYAGAAADISDQMLDDWSAMDWNSEEEE